jgi:hypothetical protein
MGGTRTMDAIDNDDAEETVPPGMVALESYDPESGEVYVDYVPASALPYPSGCCPICGAGPGEPGCECCGQQEGGD